jgi:hypothetical protein
MNETEKLEIHSAKSEIGKVKPESVVHNNFVFART